jgi:hypothetical protein
MNIFAVYQRTLKPLDLTNCTEIVVNLPNADGSFSQLKLSLAQVAITSPAVLGSFTAGLNATNYPSPNIGEFQNIDVTFTISGAPITVRFQGALSVFQV